MKYNIIYISFMALVFAGFTVLFTAFPRSTVSELERRELATFPEYTPERLASGEFTKDVSTWFSDSEPYRDVFMTASMEVKGLAGLNVSGENQITIHADAGGAEAAAPQEPVDDGHIDQFKVEDGADEKTKIASRGIIVVGSAPNARALMAYGGGSKSGLQYAEAANKYKETFGDAVNVYCMVIPNSTEYYLPDQVKDKSSSMLATVVNVHEHLADGVKPVDVYTVLGKHANEPIFLRTDHHWAPLGAYYAAQKFAEVAKVPFRDLSHYDKHVIHDYVGTMYAYSKDIAIKKSPEDFVYYTPKGIGYTTTYIDYKVDKHFNVTHEGKPVHGEFFYKFKDGSSAAYQTFMGDDKRLTKVVTDTKNHRKLLILKDSFGNALPGYLFYSFEEIHVVDGRYFNKNMKKYVADNGITDILFANNIFRVAMPSVGRGYVKFLTQ